MLYDIDSVYGSGRVGFLKAVYHLRGVGIIGTTLAETPCGLKHSLHDCHGAAQYSIHPRDSSRLVAFRQHLQKSI